MVQSELSNVIRYSSVRGPRAVEERLRRMISIVDVDVSPDLGQARVKVSVLGPQIDKISALRWLRKSNGPLRHELAQRLKHMKRVPRLTFMHVDPVKAVEVMMTLEKLLNCAELSSDALVESTRSCGVSP